MRNIAVILMVAFLGLIGCTLEKEYTFAQGFADLQELDAAYNASFKEEKLGKMMIPLENVDVFLEKLEETEEDVKETKDSRDKEAVLVFISIRKAMVISEKNYQLARKIGNIGLVEDKEGFTCGEAKYILDTAYLFNESFVAARKAISALDDLLYYYRDVEQLQELVGLDENKTQFYDSSLDILSKTIKLNHQALENNCKIKVVTKEGKDL